MDVDNAAFSTSQVLGDWLDGSGWCTSLTRAEVAASGTAASFIHASNVSKSRHAHLVTAAALYQLLEETWRESCTDLPLKEWSQIRSHKNVQFRYGTKLSACLMIDPN